MKVQKLYLPTTLASVVVYYSAFWFSNSNFSPMAGETGQIPLSQCSLVSNKAFLCGFYEFCGLLRSLKSLPFFSWCTKPIRKSQICFITRLKAWSNNCNPSDVATHGKWDASQTCLLPRVCVHSPCSRETLARLSALRGTLYGRSEMVEIKSYQESLIVSFPFILCWHPKARHIYFLLHTYTPNYHTNHIETKQECRDDAVLCI